MASEVSRIVARSAAKLPWPALLSHSATCSCTAPSTTMGGGPARASRTVSGRFFRAGEGVRTLDVHLGKGLGARFFVGEMSGDAGLPSQGVSGRPAPCRSSGYASGYAKERANLSLIGVQPVRTSTVPPSPVTVSTRLRIRAQRAAPLAWLAVAAQASSTRWPLRTRPA